MAGLFREHWPSSAEVYLADGVPAPGARFANPVLAEVYQRILAEAEAAGTGRETQIEAARRAFYEGFVAEAIADYLATAEVMDTSGTRHRGLLDRRRPGRLAGVRRAARHRSTSAASPCARPARGARARCSSSSSPCWTGSI